MICNGPLRKHVKPYDTPCMIYGRIKWKWTLLDLEKALDMANQDVLNEFDLTLEEGGGIKGLTATRNNLVVMW